MKNKLLLIISTMLLFACKEPHARRPVSQKTATILSETLQQNKALIKQENLIIQQQIAKDSIHKYINSANGFWYAYLIKIEDSNAATPKIGDVVEFAYNITDLYGAVIYSKNELGIKKYTIDKEDFIPALQEGIKLMKVGETITFVIPSYRAFGLVGDEHKIGINQTLKSTVTLLNLNQK